MAPWLQAALLLLASVGADVAGQEIQRRLSSVGAHFQGSTSLLPGLPTGHQGFIGPIQPGIRADFGAFPGVGQVTRRRRRRRALTASDRADIAFIAGILGKVAGKEIAAIIAARTG